MWIIFLVLVVFFEFIADILSKEWSLNSRIHYLMGGTFFYLIANLAWLASLKYGIGLARGASIFAVVSVVLAIIIGVGIYEEQTSRYQAAGMVLGLLSLLLIFWEEIFSK